jgi:signal transduction histidine kinase
LLENLLEWANSQRGKVVFSPVTLNLTKLINEEFLIIDEMASRKNISVQNLVSDSLQIYADKNMIRTVIRNLLTNGIKFTRKGGCVKINAVPTAENVEISVSDDGIGMNAEKIAGLFRIDVDVTTKGTDDEKGTGLGLYLCKDFIEKHGGRIWAESEKGSGSTFKFILPVNSHS